MEVAAALEMMTSGFVGLIASQLDRGLDGDVLRNAMAYGTALASYNVERFGTEALASAEIDGAAVRGRVEDLWRFGRFDPLDVELRA